MRSLYNKQIHSFLWGFL